jgi:Fe-S-cluster-containing dehydrogenase component
MANYAMAIDLTRCIGCYNCQIACKDEHVGNDFPPVAAAQPTFGQFWLSIEEKEQIWSPSHIKVTYIPKPCQQCDDAPCIKQAKDGAMYKRADGIVIIDPEKAVGQNHLVQACPYGSIYLNEEKNLPQKCTFCAHLVDDNWQEPRCAQSCPMSCMHFGDLDDPESKISKFLATAGTAEALHPEFNTKPRVKYVGLPKPHLAGTVKDADDMECAADVTVTLTGPDGKKFECVTDCFGDFRFKNVTKEKCSIVYSADGYISQSHTVDLVEDITYVGEVLLEKSI